MKRAETNSEGSARQKRSSERWRPNALILPRIGEG